MQLVFVHGWGLTPDMWTPLRKALPQYKHFTVDFGYFDTPSTLTEDLPEGAVYIGHSLGVQWLLCNATDKMAALVSISGFDSFSSFIPTKTINLMKRGLTKKSDLQLALFHKQCGLHQKLHYKSVQHDNLMAGLDSLASQNCQHQKEQLSIPVTVLASQNDAIVPPEMTKKIWSKYNIFWSGEGGHVLPLEKPRWCANHIIKLLDQVQTPEKTDK